MGRKGIREGVSSAIPFAAEGRGKDREMRTCPTPHAGPAGRYGTWISPRGNLRGGGLLRCAERIRRTAFAVTGCRGLRIGEVFGAGSPTERHGTRVPPCPAAYPSCAIARGFHIMLRLDFPDRQEADRGEDYG